MIVRSHHTHETPDPVRLRVERIYRKVQIFGARQVRLHRGWLLLYPYPAPRGYGVRGVLVGIYTLTTHLEWIEDDVAQVLSKIE